MPVCVKCGHRACEFCRTWCDVKLPDGTLCCNGKCAYAKGDVKVVKYTKSLMGRINESMPVCVKCGHRACPCCKIWCDVILPDGKLCCNGKCTY